MKVKVLIIFLIFFLCIAFALAYTADSYDDIESTLTNDYTADTYSDIDSTFGSDEAVIDITPPTYSDNSTNSTLAGTDIEHRLKWQDETGLSGYIFSFCNGTWNGSDCLGGESTNTGAQSPGTMADDNAVGDYTWTDVNYAKASDDDYAHVGSSQFSTGQSHYLKATNFGFSIPSGATIDGIKVENEWYVSIGDWQDKIVKIVKSDGSIGATNRGNDDVITKDLDVYQSWGGASDLWGESWSDSDINHENFGVVFSADCTTILNSILNSDHIRITVYYTTPGGWQNDTFVPMTGTINWSNVSKTVNSTVGANIAWRVHANDTSGNWNNSEVFSYVTTSADTCTCPGLNQNWEIDMSDYCNITEDCNLRTGKLNFTGTGETRCNATIDTTDLGDPGANGILYIQDNCIINVKS